VTTAAFSRSFYAIRRRQSVPASRRGIRADFADFATCAIDAGPEFAGAVFRPPSRYGKITAHDWRRDQERTVPLTQQDRDLIRRCLHHETGAWSEFVHRYLGLVYHVITHTAHLRSYPIRPDETEDIAAMVLLQVIDNDYSTLRQFRGKSSLSSYLTVIARRICVQELARRAGIKESTTPRMPEMEAKPSAALDTLDEVGKLLKKLPEKERTVVRMYHLEGLTYEEISEELDVPVNTIGSILTRARRKMKGEENGDE
jgi:RNA polymerase sigma-70 factor (ECF subfamily)